MACTCLRRVIQSKLLIHVFHPNLHETNPLQAAAFGNVAVVSVDHLTNSLDNAINEKCSRIKIAFLDIL